MKAVPTLKKLQQYTINACGGAVAGCVTYKASAPLFEYATTTRGETIASLVGVAIVVGIAIYADIREGRRQVLNS